MCVAKVLSFLMREEKARGFGRPAQCSASLQSELCETVTVWPRCVGPSLSAGDITHTATGTACLTWAFSPGPLLPPLTCGQGPSQFRAFWGGHERSPGVPSGGGSGYAQSDHLPSLSCVIDLGAEFHPW